MNLNIKYYYLTKKIVNENYYEYLTGDIPVFLLDSDTILSMHLNL